MPFSRRSVRTFSVISLAMLLCAGAARASRHTKLLKSEPAAGAEVATAPQQLVLFYSEAVALEVSTFKLADGRGAAVAMGAARMDVAKPGAPVVVPITGEMTSGKYVVRWSVASDDGHAVKGTFGFVVK